MVDATFGFLAEVFVRNKRKLEWGLAG